MLKSKWEHNRQMRPMGSVLLAVQHHFLGVFGAGTLNGVAAISPPANTAAGAGAPGGGTTIFAGNAGGGGGLAIYLWTAPTSQTVTIGAGGTAGGAGTAGSAGAIGAKGLFMIIEFISA